MPKIGKKSIVSFPKTEREKSNHKKTGMYFLSFFTRIFIDVHLNCIEIKGKFLLFLHLLTSSICVFTQQLITDYEPKKEPSINIFLLLKIFTFSIYDKLIFI